MFELTWQEFSRRPHIARLPLNEQVRQFQWEQQRQQILMEYVINNSVPTTATGYGSGGGVSLTTNDPSLNSFVENDYIDDYFE
jgi:hypothetical protein